MAENINREELITGEDMDKALEKAASLKIDNLTTYKEQDKTNYEQFYETVLHGRQDIVELLDKKKKNRTDADNELIKKFKKDTCKSYKMVCDLLMKEDVDEGKQTKIEKLVEKIALTFQYLRYIGANELENEFIRRGVKIEMANLENNPVWAEDRIRENVKNIFAGGRKVRETVKSNNDKIVENIFVDDVPQGLVYEKDSNPVGLKKSDWSKLVSIKTKMLMAKADEQREKVEDQTNELAGEKQFEQERAKLMQKKLISMHADEPVDEQTTEEA